jgi:flagellar secretion chaperone FliS
MTYSAMGTQTYAPRTTARPAPAMSTGYANQQASRYRDNDLASASPGRLVVMLFDQIILSVRRARMAMDAGQIELRATQIVRASDMIAELRISLDHEQGGAIATNLDALYGYMLGELLDANRRRDPAPLDRVLVMVTELRDAFAQVVASTPASPLAAVRSA